MTPRRSASPVLASAPRQVGGKKLELAPEDYVDKDADANECSVRERQ